MPHLMHRGAPGKMQFDGLHSTGNRYYVGFMNMELAGLHGYHSTLYVLEPTMLKVHTALIRYDPAEVILNSIPIAKASEIAKGAVIRHIAYHEVGISRSLPIVMEPLAGTNRYAHTETRRTRNRYTGKLMNMEVLRMKVHPYSDNIKGSHYFDIYLNLVHEKHHADTPEDAFDEVSSEYHAYKEVFEHPYFKYASDSYREHVMDSYIKYQYSFSTRRR